MGFGACAIAPTPILITNNTFIVGIEDWLDSPPPPLLLKRFESCPAAFAPASLTQSLAQACESNEEEAIQESSERFAQLMRDWVAQPTVFDRQEPYVRQGGGGMLEVNLEGLSCLRDAKARVADVLNVSPSLISLRSSRGHCVDEAAPILDSAASLQVVVLTEAQEERRREIEQWLARFVNTHSTAENTMQSRLAERVHLETQDEAAFAMKLVISCSLGDPHHCNSYVQLLSALRESYPQGESCEGSDKSRSFTRMLLATCQDEFECIFLEPSRSGLNTGIGGVQDGIESCDQNRCRALLTLLGKLLSHGEISVKVVDQIAKELTEPCSGAPTSFHVECACQLLRDIMPILQKSSKGVTMLRRTSSQLASVRDSVHQDGSFVLSEHVRHQCNDVLDAINVALQMHLPAHAC